MSMSMFRPMAFTAMRSFATAAASVAPRKFLVAVGATDMKGSIEAAKKAVSLANSGDNVECVHIPRPFPEQLLSSMSDPGAISAEGQQLFSPEALKNITENASEGIMQSIKDAVDKEAQDKGVSTKYTVRPPSNNVKVELVQYVRDSLSNYVVVGPSGDYTGRMGQWLARSVRGASVVVVRDSCTRAPEW
ncbi:hypothetical protein FOZ60_010688 [Perkinsus olseni]|uniref:UspA domain-containing protein n=2 Tax=Perkinsus olseni TaxID=32597 RepID=A0A7J6PCK6_PEROL|nr:hypothetical protein FOZ60_010688 [Perkinsus olseni]